MVLLGDDSFFFVIGCYNKSGLRKNTTLFRKIISIYILFPLLLILYTMVIFNIRYKTNSIFEIAEVFESASTFGQLVARKSILLMHAPLFEEIIKSRSHFWSYDMFGKSLGNQFRKQMNFSVSLIKKLWFASQFSLIFHFCTPFFVDNAVLPDACWIPVNNKYLVMILYALEMIFYIEVIFLLGCFDALFLCMCTDLKIQFTLLSETIQTICLETEMSNDKEEMCLKILKKCSKHHNSLLKIHKKVNDFFSKYFVCQFFMNVIGVCIQFFIINRSSNVTQILRSIVYVLIASLLGALIFFPSSIIEEEAENFHRDIYEIGWQNTNNLKIRKFIIFWLLNSQKPIFMSGSGLFQVNRNLLIQKLKTTIVRQLKQCNSKFLEIQDNEDDNIDDAETDIFDCPEDDDDEEEQEEN